MSDVVSGINSLVSTGENLLIAAAVGFVAYEAYKCYKSQGGLGIADITVCLAEGGVGIGKKAVCGTDKKLEKAGGSAYGAFSPAHYLCDWNDAKKDITKVAETVGKTAKNVAQETVNIGKNVVDKAGDTVKDITNTVVSPIKDVTHDVTNVIDKNILNPISSVTPKPIKNATSAVTHETKKITHQITHGVSSVGKSITHAFGLGGHHHKHVKFSTVDRLAKADWENFTEDERQKWNTVRESDSSYEDKQEELRQIIFAEEAREISSWSEIDQRKYQKIMGIQNKSLGYREHEIDKIREHYARQG